MTVPSAAGADWRPTASFATLRRRAELLSVVRRFFADRDVLEVETPALAACAVPDPHLASLATTYTGPGAPRGRTLHLQTSPEYAMKRLLAAGSGAIWQLARAFRDGESGPLHNPEFTLLEWYRPGFDHHRLMDEMDDLLAATLGAAPAERLTYGAAFARHVDGVDPHRATAGELAATASRRGLGEVGLADEDRDGWMQLLQTHLVEPNLGSERPAFLVDYPASQAALARLRAGERGEPAVAERFEVYVRGVELANGFHELADAAEQRRRFEADRVRRGELGLPDAPIDERLLAALDSGLPACAGVALGFDRLVMLAIGARRIEEVVTFPVERA